MIPLARPSIGDAEIEAVAAVLRSGHLVQGNEVAAFEEACASFLDVPLAVAVSSCTAALQLSLLALDLEPLARVAVPSYSWPATANAVVLAGAEVVFVDIEPDTLGMDPHALEQAAAEHLDAIVVVHPFGRLAKTTEICDHAAALEIPLLEDAACAFGARGPERGAGQYGTAGCFSFHPRKALTTGEGGLVVTEDQSIADRVRVLRNHGLDDRREFVEPGFNYRMTDFQAALGSVQVARFDEMLAQRRRAADVYDDLLSDAPVQPPRRGTTEEHALQSYVVLLDQEYAQARPEIIAAMLDLGVQATIGTIHIPMTDYYRRTQGHDVGSFPVTDDIDSRAMTLPLYETITFQEQESVVIALREALRKCAGQRA